MKSEDNKHERSAGKRIMWRSLEENAHPERTADAAGGSDVVKQTIGIQDLLRVNRRNFLTLSSSVGVLAGIEGCIRRPVEKIMPHSEAPEHSAPGIPAHYATVIQSRGEALGLLVTSHDGRPTKIEGNPEHPASGGSTDLLTQASILDLYDGDRARQPSQGKSKKSFADVDAMLGQVIEEASAARGKGLRVLAQPANSPTYLRLRDAVMRRFPEARFHTFTPVNESSEREGTRLAFGRPMAVINRFEAAKVVLSLDSDFMLTERGAVRHAKDFAHGRRLKSTADEMNRLYVVEPALSVTGSNADHRLRLPASDVQRYLMALAAELSGQHGVALGGLTSTVSGASRDGIDETWLTAVAKELAEHRGAGLLVAGSRQPAAVHALVHALNRALGNAGKTVTYGRPLDPAEPEQFGDIKKLVQDMAAGQVSNLLILGGNPVHDAPADLGFPAALEKVARSVHFAGYRDETGVKTSWVVPRAHELESWGDQRAFNGQYAIQQPLIAPLWGGRSDIELLGQLAGEQNWRGYYQVKKTAGVAGHATDQAFRELLHRGIEVRGTAALLANMPVQEPTVANALKQGGKASGLSPDNLELVFMADNKLLDGRHANNAWLQELPDPITRICWDNAAYVSPGTAKALGLENGDLVKIEKGGASLEIAVWKVPGYADNSIGLSLGWGRKRAGGIAERFHSEKVAGFDVYPLRTSDAPQFATGATLSKLGQTYTFSQTQDHDSMEGRPIAIDATLSQYKEKPNFPEYLEPDPSSGPLWEEQDYSQGYQWGMTIDLNACNGCNACAIACQAENNVPVVGKYEVSRGREMHWFRIDRYYVGDENNPEVAFQPIGCQHCEIAPCENVCPVNATSHTPEGMNDIAYNRCVGTRYCMNNCPYKVRRFNFMNFNLDIAESQKMVYNPNVSVRFRGVVEKCSYCVQRVQTAKISAKVDGRKLEDGDVTSACQDSCPTEAITFGDINDPRSKVAKARALDRNYALLASIGTKPRTRFLGKVRNPNPEMQA